MTIVLVREAAKNDFFTSKSKTYFGRPDDEDKIFTRLRDLEGLARTVFEQRIKDAKPGEVIDYSQYAEVNDKWEPLHMAHDHGLLEEKSRLDSNEESEMKSEEKKEVVSLVEPVTITAQVSEMVNETVDATNGPKADLLKDYLVSSLEKEDLDSKNVVDVKVAFSNDQNEQVLDPKLDFSNLKMNFGDNNTLNNLGKSCMDLGIVLGDLMADVPDVIIIFL